MSGVLVLGALHHDVVVDAPRLPRLDETLVGSGVDYRFGGKGGNQALAAARMGAAVRMAGRVGRDDTGRGVLAVLDAAGIDRGDVQFGKGPTGMSVAIADADGSYGAVIVSGANLENDGKVTLDPAPRIALIQNEIPEAANRRLAANLAEATLLIWNAAPARPRDADLEKRTDLLVVNRVEAEDLTGESDAEVAARLLHGRVRGGVIVTLGADGVVFTRSASFACSEISRGSARGQSPLAHRDARGGAKPDIHVTHMSGHDVTPVSTHGAGDMFTGALAARLADGADLEKAIELAQVAAALFVAAPIAERAAINRTAVEAHSP